jgi:hypothetical protein
MRIESMEIVNPVCDYAYLAAPTRYDRPKARVDPRGTVQRAAARTSRVGQ